MKNLRIEAVIIGLGLLLAGWCVYCGFTSLAERDRTVSVRGFSERTVDADKVTWPIKLKLIGDDIASLSGQINVSKAKVVKFLKENGIPEKDIAVAAPKVTDYTMQDYKPDNIKSRYAMEMMITVASNKVDLVRSLTYRTADLMAQGVTIAGEDYGQGINYEYSGLDKIKPAMIEASTKNAREAAEKFAKDSGSKLGKIKSATQGYFSIDDRDQNTPWIKKVRVVTSVEYYLKN